ncbi:MAG TPA: hypothetical protein VLW25_00200 [Bryobacteraceae bacterium]|nr:hypothetical protein [Bryobacteraceae bacterium]
MDLLDSATMVATGIAAGQKPRGNVQVVTVCDVLRDVSRYHNRAVAVVGRVERTVSLIDHYEFLSQDRCEHPVVTHGHTWPNKIQIWATGEEGMPKPPSDRPELKPSALALRLSAVRKTTERGTHQEPGINAGGHSIVYIAIPNQWGVLYGRIAKNPDLDEDCGADGCGGDDVPLVIIAEPYNVHGLREDGMPLQQ